VPTYDLSCNTCGHRFELFVMRLLRQDDQVCPECGSSDVRKGIGGGVVMTASTKAAGGGTGSCGTASRFG